MSDPNTITYQAGAIEHATGTLQSASASLEQCKADLTNVNALLASHMGGQYHSAYQEAMLQIEQPLQHLAEVVGQHGQVLNSITSDALALDASLAAGGLGSQAGAHAKACAPAAFKATICVNHHRRWLVGTADTHRNRTPRPRIGVAVHPPQRRDARSGAGP